MQLAGRNDTGTWAGLGPAAMMANDTISLARHKFPPEIVRQAVWLYLRFTLGFRDVEDLLAERWLVCHETVRVLKFGPLFGKQLRRRRHRPTPLWHLDEMAVLIGGRRFWLWRVVDDEFNGVAARRRRRGSCASCSRVRAFCLRRWSPISCAPIPLLGLSARHEQGLRKNKRAGNSHLPVRRRERKIQRFKSAGSARRFLLVHAAVHNMFNIQRYRISSHATFCALRGEALQHWLAATAAWTRAEPALLRPRPSSRDKSGAEPEDIGLTIDLHPTRHIGRSPRGDLDRSLYSKVRG
jgi:putative transposase